MSLFGVAFLEAVRAGYRRRHKAELRQQRDERQAARDIRSLEQQGIISRGDSPETRFRKILAHQGLGPEEIERKVVQWRVNFRQITGREPG